MSQYLGQIWYALILPLNHKAKCAADNIIIYFLFSFQGKQVIKVYMTSLLGPSPFVVELVTRIALTLKHLIFKVFK